MAAVLIETIPATYGFPLPEPGYLQGVKRLCERYGALYIADEVQTGLMRTGEMWGITKAGVEPDIMVIGKGITGGMYPIACVVVSEECSAWLKEDGFGHISTGGGAELGCVVALKVLEICGRPEVRSMVAYIADRFGRGLRAIQELYPDWFVGIRQDGVVMGLEFDHPQGAKIVMKQPLRERRVGDLLDARPARAAVQAAASCSAPSWSTRCSTAPRCRSSRRSASSARERRWSPMSTQAAEAAGVPRARMMLQRAHWAATAFAVFRPDRTPDRRIGCRSGIPKRRKIRRMGRRGDRDGRRRAQAAQERGLLQGRRRVVRRP